ncbi:MAG: tyrosinase family protein [Cyanomargarita calcarea GSE-NOS-MK-12-04C]|uniref:Tyrosinase family protein n=1 Tax=Cyanomargarita calcarea GSE-NOS-MK-12-04C TaxID=2839659 RepID=A0A951QSM4_9CYAN|nr:tyrosinase family protein [Cyanomargarita calcarea GSE-NOS-MK-12-04C]
MKHLHQRINLRFANAIATFSMTMTLVITVLNVPGMAATFVRKNVIDLTPQEKIDFVEAIKTLKKIPGTNSKNVSIYDEVVAIHSGAMTFDPMQLGGNVILPQDKPSTGPATGSDAAHENAGFLPWHREYLDRFEKALQSVNPNVTIPYWDWADPRSVGVIFDPNFLGTNGSGRTEILEYPDGGPTIRLEGGPVVSGNFSEADGWRLIPDLHSNIGTAESLGTSLVRFLPSPSAPPGVGFPLDRAETDRIVKSPDYQTFRRFVEGEISLNADGTQRECGNFPCNHNFVHGTVGGSAPNPNLNEMDRRILTFGTMSNTPGSPNDPVFWLLHSNVERLWAEWQDDGHPGSAFYPATGEKYGHNLNDKMWPWDGGDSIPGFIGSTDIRPYLPIFASSDIVRPIDTLELGKYSYTYDTLVKKVPETTSTSGLLALGALGIASLALSPKRLFWP